ncbi:MAG: hypothetical protein AB1728_15330, partial [Bacteroidota bacterium]
MEEEKKVAMAKVFVLGAGFSKAVADLPLSKELFSAFELQLKEQEAQKYLTTIRSNCGKTILHFFNKLEIIVKESFPAVPIQSTNIRNNFESVLSFIDLAILSPINGEIVRGNEKSDFSSPVNIQGFDLNEVKRCI